MPRGPKGEKRPADANQRAVMVARIATGEIEDKVTDDGKNAAAVALGRMGGKARASITSVTKGRSRRSRYGWPYGQMVVADRRISEPFRVSQKNCSQYQAR